MQGQPFWLPLTRELSAKLTEGEKNQTIRVLSWKIAIFQPFYPSVKTYGFATSLVRGR